MIFLEQQQWNAWFAGLVDGDGYFYINKQNQISFELTVPVCDLKLLSNIKQKLNGGSIKIRSGSNSVRYRVKNQSILRNIVNRLNGQLYNPIRLTQFKKVCFILNINLYLFSNQLSNAYLSGLIDSDGTISISVSKSNAMTSQLVRQNGKIIRLSQSKGHHQLSVKITSVQKDYLQKIQKKFQLGKIYSEKANHQNKKPNVTYHWIIQTAEELMLLYTLLRKCTLKSKKMHRIRLIPIYFKYKELNYHLKETNTLEYKCWLTFCKSWFRYTF